jgi:hypothetical protein
VDALRRTVAAQQRQLESQSELLQTLQSQVDSLYENGDLSRGIVEGPLEPLPGIPPDVLTNSQPQGVMGSRTSEAARYDLESPTGSNVSYYDPADAINIPGTDVGIFGFAEFQIFHDGTGLNNNRFDTAFIPVDGVPSQTKFSVNPTRIAFSSSPAIPGGRLTALVSGDFNGLLDRPDPRLRIAFGEYVCDDLGFAILGGQTYSTLGDLRAVPETLDFAGPAALWAQRQPLCRVSKALTDGIIMEVPSKHLKTPST